VQKKFLLHLFFLYLYDYFIFIFDGMLRQIVQIRCFERDALAKAETETLELSVEKRTGTSRAPVTNNVRTNDFCFLRSPACDRSAFNTSVQ
jgi:hypothetical protein